MRLRALDLFCGAGGASMGLFLAGFHVTGVDIKPQPRYPFNFVQADALTFPLDGFDFIWASPPCQAYTLAQRIRGNKHPDLIAPIRERLTLCGAMFDGLRVYRHRLFETNFALRPPEHPEHHAPLKKMGRRPGPGDFIHVVGNFSGVEQARGAMGIDWMSRDELREAIPPAYSRFIAEAAHNRRDCDEK